MTRLSFWIRGDWGWLKFWRPENRVRPFFVIVGGQYISRERDERLVAHIRQWIWP